MTVTVIVLRGTLAITIRGMGRTLAIRAGAITISLRRTPAPSRVTGVLPSILVEDRHAVLVLHDGPAIFAILVDEQGRIAVFDGRSKILTIRGEHGCGLREGRSGAKDEKH